MPNLEATLERHCLAVIRSSEFAAASAQEAPCAHRLHSRVATTSAGAPLIPSNFHNHE